MKVFISYRRDDSIVHARLVHNELVARFGAGDVFMDIDDIDYGEDFARKIDAHLDASDVVVAVIGPRWADLLQRRARADDYVRHELSRALARSIRIVPVLVDHAAPPGPGLPPDLEPLRRLNALNLDPRALKPQLNALVEAVQGRSFEDVTRDLRRRLRSLRQAQWVGAVVGVTIFLAGWVAVLDFAGVDTRTAAATMALAPYRGDPPWSGQVVLVAIDRESVERVGRPFDASWRREHALLVRKLAQAGVRAVAFDLFFDQPGQPQDDAALAAAIRAAAPMPVIVGIHQRKGDRPVLSPAIAAEASFGIACAGQKLGYARSLPLAVEHGEQIWASLALSAFSGAGKVEALDPLGQHLRVRLVREELSPDVPFSLTETVRSSQPQCTAIRRGDTVALQLLDLSALPSLHDAPRRLRYGDVLAAPAGGPLLEGIRGRIVLVGLTLRGQDFLPLPRGGGRFGVELIASEIDALVRGDSIRLPGPLGALSAMLVAAAVGAFSRRAVAHRSAPLRLSALAAAALALVLAAIAIYRIGHVLINLAYLLVAFGASWWMMGWLDKRRLT